MSTALSVVLSEIFNNRAEARFDSAEAEREAIQEAKNGSSDAVVSLMYAYAAAIRSAVSRFTGPDAARFDQDELRSAVVLGFMEAINAFAPEASDRLAGVIRDVLARTLREEFPCSSAFTVPTRTLTRFYSILRKADGNVYEGAALAPEFGMTTETFLSVLTAVRNVSSLDATAPNDPDEIRREVVASPIWDNSAAEEDAELVRHAFQAVDDLEADVCRLAYGFADYDPVPDAEIGARLGLSRPKTQRVRSGALTKMRKALAVA